MRVALRQSWRSVLCFARPECREPPKAGLRQPGHDRRGDAVPGRNEYRDETLPETATQHRHAARELRKRFFRAAMQPELHLALDGRCMVSMRIAVLDDDRELRMRDGVDEARFERGRNRGERDRQRGL